MGEFFLTLFIFVGVISVTLLLFGGWVAMAAAKGVGKLAGAVLNGPTKAQRLCGHPECRQLNPTPAKFCRRCGRPMTERLLGA